MATLYLTPDQDMTTWIGWLRTKLQQPDLDAGAAQLELESAWSTITAAAIYEFPDGVDAWVRGLVLRLAAETVGSPGGARVESLAIDDFRVGYDTTGSDAPGYLTDEERRQLRRKYGPTCDTRSARLVADLPSTTYPHRSCW